MQQNSDYHVYYDKIWAKLEIIHAFTSGGGLVERGEVVEVVEIPRDGIESFCYDESKPKPPGCMMACLWWLNNHSHLNKW
jgi:hypothetical protein